MGNLHSGKGFKLWIAPSVFQVHRSHWFIPFVFPTDATILAGGTQTKAVYNCQNCTPIGVEGSVKVRFSNWVWYMLLLLSEWPILCYCLLRTLVYQSSLALVLLIRDHFEFFYWIDRVWNVLSYGLISYPISMIRGEIFTSCLTSTSHRAP